MTAPPENRMRIVMFYHSLISCWNHGNAHFLRGVARELKRRGHDVRVYEPADSWSLQNLLEEGGAEAVRSFNNAYPDLCTTRYVLSRSEVEQAVDGADLVIVHEWNEHELVRIVGECRAARGDFHLLFHDTHHRCVTAPHEMEAYDLSNYDGVLAYGKIIRDIYLSEGWAQRAWTWHEAADVTMFRPFEDEEKSGDLVWIGNWGDDERAAELQEFLLEPAKSLGLRARVHGVRYPQHALAALADAGIEYGGWLANFDAPRTYAKYRATVHVPRRPYVEALPGIPTIRPFEALACGIPLVSAPWDDTERLFERGKDFLVARNGGEMKRHLHDVLNDDGLARELSQRGRATILKRHTCKHRVDELLEIVGELEDTPAVRTATA